MEYEQPRTQQKQVSAIPRTFPKNNQILHDIPIKTLKIHRKYLIQKLYAERQKDDISFTQKLLQAYTKPRFKKIRQI